MSDSREERNEKRKSLAEQHRTLAASFAAKLEKVTDWSAPAPVAGWTARDVVGHLVDWSRSLLGGAEGVTLAPVPSVAGDPVETWRKHSEQMQTILDNPKSLDLELENEHFGRQPWLEAFETFYVPDIFMHTWDLARASGQESGLDQLTCAQMLEGMQAREEMIRSSGQFGEQQPVAADASSEDKLMAFIGRDPNWAPPAPTA
ncbi:maleylpyruvate isomerase family mycothiol-dependent enzyme [Luteococcus peritonei]|uniref:Maleylpyruvate isomerase family mycothiol-dependent enzyme n=1 Tax=Luteococcus peritonei TaxID=88874 RepID=A0ABW4RV61_9ACTN